MKKIIIKFILTKLLLSLLSILNASAQNEINNDLEFDTNIDSNKEKKDPNIIFRNYLISLFEIKVLLLKDIENYISVIENGPIVNPFDCNEKNQSLCKNTAYILHRDGFKKILNSHKNNLNKMAIIDDLKKFTEKESESKAAKEKSITEQKDLHIMDFAIIPPGDYRIFYKLERVGPHEDSINSSPSNSPLTYLPFQSIKDFIENLFLEDTNLPKTYYRFPKLKLHKSFELATTLVTEKLYIYVMRESSVTGKFPFVYDHSTSNDNTKEVNIDGKIIKYFSLKPIELLSYQNAIDFIKKLNQAVVNGDKDVLKLLGSNKKCVYDFINKDQYNYLKYLYFKDNYFYKASSDTEKLLSLEDALFFSKEVIFKRNIFNINNYLNRGLKKNPYLDIVEKLTLLDVDLFHTDHNQKIKKLRTVNFKISDPFHHNEKYYKSTIFHEHTEGTASDNIYTNKNFKINGYDIYDLFYNKFIFIKSENSVLFDTGNLFPKNHYYESLFRGYADEVNFNELTYHKEPSQVFYESNLKYLVIKEDQNITDKNLISSNLNKFQLNAMFLKNDLNNPINIDYAKQFYMGIRLVRYCEEDNPKLK